MGRGLDLGEDIACRRTLGTGLAVAPCGDAQDGWSMGFSLGVEGDENGKGGSGWIMKDHRCS